MADIYGSHFEYNGEQSLKYGLIIANVESGRFTDIAGEISGETVFNRKNTQRHLIGDNYVDSPISFEVDIVTTEGRRLTRLEQRAIEKWLFNRHAYKKLYLDPRDDCNGETTEIIDGEPKRLYLNCRFINPKKLEYFDGVAGYTATLEADSCMWWQDAITYSFPISNPTESSSTTITLTVDTDLDDYIYPTVKFTMGSSSNRNVRIINLTDDNTRFTEIDSVDAEDVVTIKSNLNYISGDYYDRLVNANFPRLMDGENVIEVWGDITNIEFEFNNRRFL